MRLLPHKALLLQRLHESGRHELVVLAGVADVGEHLGEGFLVVDVTEVAVLGQLLLIMIIGVDVCRGIVVVGLAMDKAPSP